jgi:hypothetical protein
MRDKESGKSRAFGFVTFACSFMAEAALESRLTIFRIFKVTEVVRFRQFGFKFLNEI